MSVSLEATSRPFISYYYCARYWKIICRPPVKTLKQGYHILSSQGLSTACAETLAGEDGVSDREKTGRLSLHLCQNLRNESRSPERQGLSAPFPMVAQSGHLLEE